MSDWSTERVVDEYNRLLSYGYAPEEIEPFLRSEAARIPASLQVIEAAIDQARKENV